MTKSKKAKDERAGRARFVDQPGQWVDKTPASVKKRRSQGLASLRKELEKNGKRSK